VYVVRKAKTEGVGFGILGRRRKGTIKEDVSGSYLFFCPLLNLNAGPVSFPSFPLSPKS
jgi:hypothetical protein